MRGRTIPPKHPRTAAARCSGCWQTVGTDPAGNIIPHNNPDTRRYWRTDRHTRCEGSGKPPRAADEVKS